MTESCNGTDYEVWIESQNKRDEKERDKYREQVRRSSGVLWLDGGM